MHAVMHLKNKTIKNAFVIILFSLFDPSQLLVEEGIFMLDSKIYVIKKTILFQTDTSKKIVIIKKYAQIVRDLTSIKINKKKN